MQIKGISSSYPTKCWIILVLPLIAFLKVPRPRCVEGKPLSPKCTTKTRGLKCQHLSPGSRGWRLWALPVGHAAIWNSGRTDEAPRETNCQDAGRRPWKATRFINEGPHKNVRGCDGFRSNMKLVFRLFHWTALELQIRNAWTFCFFLWTLMIPWGQSLSGRVQKAHRPVLNDECSSEDPRCARKTDWKVYSG